MKKLLTLIALLTSTTLPICAQEWIDVTDAYITNPRFASNISGWTVESPNGTTSRKTTSYTNGTSSLSSGFLETFVNAGGNLGTGKIYQEINPRKGQYRITADIIAVQQSSGWNWWGGGSSESPATNTYLYASNSEGRQSQVSVGTANNKPEKYSVEFNATDGKSQIGISFTNTNANWIAVDNFKLEYYGTKVLATDVKTSSSKLNLIPDEVQYLSAYVLPEDATYPNVTWSSSNSTVVSVDQTGKVTALKEGSVLITAKTKDGTNLTATCTVIVKKGEVMPGSIVINEIMASNVDVYRDPSTNFGSWVEVYNPTDNATPLNGLYVTDDANNLKKNLLNKSYGVISAKGHKVLHFDHHEVWTEVSYNQIDDKLDPDGGTIIISDGEKILAQMDYPEAISRMSYARTEDGGDTWSWTGTPTPGSSNAAGGGFATQQLDAPIVDKDAQLFTGSMQVCVNIPSGATLRYTTDGTTPTLTNGSVSKTGLFTVKNNVSYRFRLFQNGYLPSPVVTRTYIYNNGNYPFPILSVVTDRKNIDQGETAIFSYSDYGKLGSGQTTNKYNANMDWDRPVSVEYITTNNECIVSQECDFSACGGWSRGWTPHSFKLKASKIYDFKNTFNAQLFDEKPYIKNKTLQIRNGGNDNNCRIKDPAIQGIVSRSGLNVDYQSFQPVHVFYNGEHQYVLNMREPNNKHYAYANYGIDTDEMDQFEMSPDSGYVQMEGTKDAFNRLIELSANAEEEATYEEIQKLLDIDMYINYMAVELYTGNWDWPQNNVKGFRDVNDGKFRFVLFDMDGSLSTSTPFTTFFGKETYNFDSLYGYDYSLGKSIQGTRRNQKIEFVTLFKNLLKNDVFRKKFIDTYCIVGGSVFQESKVKSIVNEISDQLSTGGYVNPSNTANTLISSFTSSYNSNLVNQMKSNSNMKLSQTVRQAAQIGSNVSEAKIMFNDIELPYSEFNGYFFSPAAVKAVAPAGYEFAGWVATASTSATSLFATGSAWKYIDAKSLDGVNWKDGTDTESWKSGYSPLGYGKDQKTTVAGNKSTYYFRKNISVTKSPANATFTLDWIADDGFVVYVNGVEAGRYNMNSGTPNYSDLASTYANGNPDNGSMTLDNSLFKQGTNVIAVEVHNNSASSSDIYWEASLSMSVVDTSEGFLSTDAEYTLPTSGSAKLTAIFEPIPTEELLADGITPVRVNEISAANSMYINDYFKKNDWIELYNTTDSDIDLAGMYISDKTEKPTKYQVPNDDVALNTIIPAHGHKVVWCDKLDNIGKDIHASFKLAAEGGDVVITFDPELHAKLFAQYPNTKTLADTLTYAEHTGVQSFGRYPDGSNNAYVMNTPTICKTNILNSVDKLYAPSIGDVEDDPTAIHTYVKEGGIVIAFVDGVVNAKSDDSKISALNIYSASGMKMAVGTQKRAGEQFISANVANLPKGIYIASAISVSGDECYIKFVIK